MTTSQQTTAHEEHWDCALIQDTLPLFLDDEVSPDSRSLIIEHLSNCPHCAGFLAGAQSTRGHLRHRQPRAPSPPVARQPAPASVPLVSNRLSFQGLLGMVLLTIGTLWLAAALTGFGRSMLAPPVPMATATPIFTPIELTVMPIIATPTPYAALPTQGAPPPAQTPTPTPVVGP
ncbi:MAG: zf-HC2 domain-containing protein [Chloroflexales bacterium]|nr:zf-HC2 domain-containing protein [Chloroflexales bacterium]